MTMYELLGKLFPTMKPTAEEISRNKAAKG